MHGFPELRAFWRAHHHTAHCGCGPHDHGHGGSPFDHHFGGPDGRHGHRHGPHGHGSDDPRGFGGGDDGGGFGVRRPLRFLAWKLELEESQVAELARILHDLKTERAQASVDERRTISALADAIAGATWDEAKAAEAGEGRVKTAQALKDAVVKALGRIHAMLEPIQRDKLAYLLRTGVLSI